LLYYSGKAALDPPKAYTPSRVKYQQASDGVFVATMNDPKRLNCMSLHMMQEVLLVIEHARRDERCSVLIWTGEGRAFCAGGNFTDASTSVPTEVYDGYIHAGIAVPLPDLSVAAQTRAMVKFPKISIAAVNGICVGGGVNMALVWQDFVYVEKSAKFRYPFAELGLVPELGSSFLLPKLIGHIRAKELLQLGREFSADECKELGLCTSVVGDGEALAAALQAAGKLASFPQQSLRESKRLLNKELVARIDEVTQDELVTFRKAITSPETQKAMAAVMKKMKSKL